MSLSDEEELSRHWVFVKDDNFLKRCEIGKGSPTNLVVEKARLSWYLC